MCFSALAARSRVLGRSHVLRVINLVISRQCKSVQARDVQQTRQATKKERTTEQKKKKSTYQPGYDINRFCGRVVIFSLLGRWDGRQMEAGRKESGPEEGDGPLLPVAIRPGLA
jgi:hypothetical protein